MIENADILELQDRYNHLVKKYADLALELAPKIDKMGKIRQELQILVIEFKRRGVSVDDPAGLKAFVEAEIEKRTKESNGSPPDQR